MAKKKKSKGQPFAVKFILVTLLVIGIGYGISSGLIYLFRNSQYFRIRSVIIDPSLQFINKRDLHNIIGKNIFEIDLKGIKRRLSYKYPQASQLKVVKHFPDQIAIAAKERHPFVQIKMNNQAATLDEEGIVLSIKDKANDDLPLIIGLSQNNRRLVRGLPFSGTDTQIALEIAGSFKANKGLSSRSIKAINVENLSKIDFTLSDGLKIILDRNNISQKIRVLEVVLAQDTLDLKQVKYVDLRFKEPVIGKK